jgi:EF-P beta-lysylation protein EpmB
LLRQVLPLAEELEAVRGYGPDPVGDHAAMRAPGVLQKYRGRVLLTATGACAVHCRYCFRREFPYGEANAAADHWRAAVEHVAADTSIEEVILSGGDPLTLSDRRLGECIERLVAIHHVKRLRIHSRLPVVLPERVTAGLCNALTGTRLHIAMVTHANHAQELDGSVQSACARLRDCDTVLLNQSVLLRGVNDRVEVLRELSGRLFEIGVLPYYLHLLDRVNGAAHFDVPEPQAARLVRALQAAVPGYLVPRLVRETPGAPGKTPIA